MRLPLLIAVFAACHPHAVEPPRARPRPAPSTATPASAASAAATEKPPAYWRKLGATVAGPRLGNRTVLLVSGQLAWIDDTGAVTTVGGAPDGLFEVTAVPTASGPVVIARDGERLYRFDAELRLRGPLAAIDDRYAITGSIPGFAVLDRQPDAPADGQTEPVLVDVETGAVDDTGARAHHWPLRRIRFRDANDGIALVRGVGWIASHDGGTSWQPVSIASGGDPLADPPPPAQLRDGFAGEDPLTAAIQRGVAIEPGFAVVARANTLARVDLHTGRIADTVACSVPWKDDPGWSACNLVGRDDSELWLVRGGDPVAVTRNWRAVRDAVAAPRPGSAAFAIHQSMPPVWPFAGGVAVLEGECSSPGKDSRPRGDGFWQLCVIEGERRWQVPGGVDAMAFTRLRDGRVVTALRDSGPGYGPSYEPRRLLARIHSAIAPAAEIGVDLPVESRAIDAVTMYEPTAGHIRMLLEVGGAPGAVVVNLWLTASGSPNEPEIRVREVPPEERERTVMNGRFGVMNQGGRTFRSDDNGASWQPLDATFDSPRAGELGVADRHLGLIGWGPAPPRAQEPKPAASWSPPATDTRAAVVLCHTSGSPQPSPHATDAADLVDVASAGDRAAENGAAAELHFDRAADVTTRTWRLSWQDAAGGKHVWRGRPPARLSFDDRLTFITRGQSAALFFNASENAALRAIGREGPPENAHRLESGVALARGDWLQFLPVRNVGAKPMLADDGSAIAWENWRPGEDPSLWMWRGGDKSLGIRVQLTSADERVLPIGVAHDRLWALVNGEHIVRISASAMAAFAAGQAESPHPPLPGLPLDGWLARRQLLGSLPPVCAAGDRRDAIELESPLPVAIVAESAPPPAFGDIAALAATVTVRVSPGAAPKPCLAAFRTSWLRDQPVRVLRYDFQLGRGQARLLAFNGGDSVQAMRCERSGWTEKIFAQ